MFRREKPQRSFVQRFWRFLRGVLFGVNLLAVAPLLLARLAPYVAPSAWFWPQVLAIYAHWWLWLPLPWLAVWGWRRRWLYLSANAVLLVLCWPIFGHFYQTHEPLAARATDIRVVSWNVNAFTYFYARFEQAVGFLKPLQPDVLCLQEYRNKLNHTPAGVDPLQKLGEELKLPHRIFIDLLPPSQFGLAILSKYPITDGGNLLKEDRNANGIAYADLQLYGETVRVYNLHLQSYNFQPGQRRILTPRGEEPEVTTRQGWGLIKVLLKTWRKQAEQLAAFEREAAHNAPNTVVCTDLNNAPYGYFYRRVRGELQDTYRERGSGRGTTYPLGRGPVRIDYVFAGSAFTVAEHRVVPSGGISDHHAVVTRLRFRFH